MIQNNVGEMIFNEQDVCDLLMSGKETTSIKRMLVDSSVNIEHIVDFVDRMPEFIRHVGDPTINMTVFDQRAQSCWRNSGQHQSVRWCSTPAAHQCWAWLSRSLRRRH